MKLNNTAFNYTGLFFNGIILLVLLLFFMNYFNDLEWELRFSITLLAVLSMAVLVLSYRQTLLYGLGFIIPLSVPFGLFGGSQISLPAELICVCLTIFLLIKVALGTRPDLAFLKHPVTLLILADLGWLFIASVFSQMPEVSFKRFIVRCCYYIAFYYFYSELFKQGHKNIKKLFTLHVAGFLVPIGYAMIRHAQLGFTTVGSQQISAPFYFDHTIYGAGLVFFIPFLLHYSFGDNPFKERVFYRTLLAIFISAAILSYSRAALLSLVIALAAGFCLKYKVRFSYLAVFTLVAAAVLSINLQRISTFVKENKETSHSNDVSMHFKSISNLNTDASNKERINRWKCALRMFADKPIAGFGPGTYQFFYGQYQQRQDMTRISTFNGTKGHAHSEYLNYLSETGIIGCLIFLALVTTVILKSLRLVKSKNTTVNGISLYILCGLITFFIHAFFNGFLEFDKIAMPVFSSFAAITASISSNKAPDPNVQHHYHNL